MQNEVATFWTRKRRHQLIYLSYGLLIVLFLMRIWVNGVLNQTSKQLDALTGQTKTLHYQNMQLKDGLLQRTSYTTIATKAHQEGFVQAQYIYLGN
jgi:hypothetical protein